MIRILHNKNHFIQNHYRNNSNLIEILIQMFNKKMKIKMLQKTKNHKKKMEICIIILNPNKNLIKSLFFSY